MTTPFERNIIVDDRLNSYHSFYDPEWAGKIHDLSEGTAFEESVYSLCLNWKSANNVQAMPGLLIGCLHGYQVGFLSTTDPQSKVFFRHLSEMVLEKLQLNYKKRKTFNEAVESAIDLIDQSKGKINESCTISPEQLWREFLNSKDQEFSIVIWGSQRICYGAIFHAYEDFIRDVISVVSQNPHYRTGGFSGLKKDFRQYFGKQMCKYCVSGEPIDIARKVRNRLAHNGGKVSDELRNLPHGIRLNSNDILQIMPENNRELFDLLKERTLKLAETAETSAATESP